jgi:hypothetical protein
MSGAEDQGCGELQMQQILKERRECWNVPWHCELDTAKFTLQRAMQENPFGLRGDMKV